MTVAMTTSLAVMILLFEGPPRTTHANISATLDPGAGGWNSADETIKVRHLGGDRLQAGFTLVSYRLNGAPSVGVTGGSLGGAFGDGTLSTGETWTFPLPLSATDTVTVSIIDTHGRASRVLVGRTLTPASLGSGPSCSLDAFAPTAASWTQNPSNLQTTTPPGSVTVTITATDDCHGVNTAVTPQLWWCLNGGTCTYAQAPAMTFVSGTTWQGVIPSQTWSLQGGKTLQYQVRQLTDMGGNAGTAQGVDDLISVVTTYTYVGCPLTATTGTVASCAELRDAGPATATLTEAQSGTAAQPESQLFGTATTGSSGVVAGSSCSAPSASDCALTQNVEYARLDGSSDVLRVTGFTSPGGAVGFDQVVLGIVARRVDGSNPNVRITYTGTGLVDPSSVERQFSSTSPATYETDITADRTWTTTDIANFIAQIDAVGGNVGSSRRIDVDVVYLKVIHRVPAYAMNIEGAFTGVPAGAAQALQVAYSASGDSFSLQVCQDAAPVCGAWTTRATLTSATMTQIIYSPMSAAEYNSGAPRIRFLASNGVTSAGSLSVDYVRVATT